MKIIRDQRLEDDVLDFDDIYLVNCVVNNCEIFYSGGEFAWANTKFENCKLRLRGPARNTERILWNFGLLKKTKLSAMKEGDSTPTVH